MNMTTIRIVPLFTLYALAIQRQKGTTCIDLKRQSKEILERLQSVTITRGLLLRSARPADSRNASRVCHGDEAENHEQDVRNALPGAGGDGAVVHQRL